MKTGLMLAKASKPESLKTGNWTGYDMEPKYDGMRVAIVKQDDKVVVYGRSWIEYTEHVPHIVEAIKQFPGDVHLDGELAFITEFKEICFKEVPIVDFNKTMRCMGSLPAECIRKQENGNRLTFIAFDLIGSGHDADRRMLMVDKVMQINSPWVLPIPRWTVWLPELYQQLVDAGVEGVMMKNRVSLYSKGRPNKTWYKVKSAVTEEVIVMGFTSGNGKFAGQIGAIKFGQIKDGQLKYRGRCSGLNDALRSEISADPTKFLGRVMEVKLNGVVGTTGFRHPNFVTFRDDKKPEECIWT